MKGPTARVSPPAVQNDHYFPDTDGQFDPSGNAFVPLPDHFEIQKSSGANNRVKHEDPYTPLDDDEPSRLQISNAAEPANWVPSALDEETLRAQRLKAMQYLLTR